MADWINIKNSMQATEKLCTILKNHHSSLNDSYGVIIKILLFLLSAVYLIFVDLLELL